MPRPPLRPPPPPLFQQPDQALPRLLLHLRLPAPLEPLPLPLPLPRLLHSSLRQYHPNGPLPLPRLLRYPLPLPLPLPRLLRLSLPPEPRCYQLMESLR